MKIGIMGGSFDPIHFGHLDMAEKCLNEFCLDKIMFLPSSKPPHKQNITDSKIRIEMISEAIAPYPDFFLNIMEIEREGTTYTFDTAVALNNTNDDYYFIIGGDSLNNLHKWYKAEELFKIMKFIVVDRCNVDEDASIAKIMGAQLYFSKYTGLDVSSTEIRLKVKNDEDINEFIPQKVVEIIRKYGLYKN